MPFFVSMKKIDKEVEKHFYEMVRQQGLQEMQAALEDTKKNVDSVGNTCGSGLRELKSHMDSGLEELNLRLDCELRELSGRLDDVGEINVNKVDADIKTEVMHYVDSITEDIIKNIEKNVAATEEKVHREIYDAVELSIRSDLNTYIVRTMNMYFQNIKSENDNRDLQILSLRKEIDQERKNNVRLLEMVQKQEGELVQLTELIHQLQEKNMIAPSNIEDGSAQQIPGQVSAGGIAWQKEGQDTAAQPAPAKIAVLFGDCAKENEMTLKHFLEETRKLRKELVESSADCEILETNLKAIDKCLKKFGNLLVKFKEKQYDSDKLANESAKILKQTIVLALSQQTLKPYIDRYMERCGVRKLNWKVGKRLTDEDYDYFNEQILYDEVAERPLNNTITAICQDAFIIDYEEDDKLYEAIMPGIYHIGKYKG